MDMKLATDNMSFNYLNVPTDESNYLTAALNLSEIARFFNRTPSKKVQRRAAGWVKAVEGVC
jgi:hypothetical protein